MQCVVRNAVCEPITIHTLCHCEEAAQATDAAIHRVAGGRGRLVSSVTGSQWIATSLGPRDDNKWQEISFV